MPTPVKPISRIDSTTATLVLLVHGHGRNSAARFRSASWVKNDTTRSRSGSALAERGLIPKRCEALLACACLAVIDSKATHIARCAAARFLGNAAKISQAPAGSRANRQ